MGMRSNYLKDKYGEYPEDIDIHITQEDIDNAKKNSKKGETIKKTKNAKQVSKKTFYTTIAALLMAASIVSGISYQYGYKQGEKHQIEEIQNINEEELKNKMLEYFGISDYDNIVEPYIINSMDTRTPGEPPILKNNEPLKYIDNAEISYKFIDLANSDCYESYLYIIYKDYKDNDKMHLFGNVTGNVNEFMRMSKRLLDLKDTEYVEVKEDFDFDTSSDNLWLEYINKNFDNFEEFETIAKEKTPDAILHMDTLLAIGENQNENKIHNN